MRTAYVIIVRIISLPIYAVRIYNHIRIILPLKFGINMRSAFLYCYEQGINFGHEFSTRNDMMQLDFKTNRIYLLSSFAQLTVNPTKWTLL